MPFTSSPSNQARSVARPSVSSSTRRRAREALAEALELAAVAAEARAEDDASAAEAVQGRQGERQILDAPARHRRDARPEHDPGRAQRAGREGDPRIRGRHAPREGEVVPDEEAVPARGLCVCRELGDEPRVGVRADVGAEEPVLHGYKLCGSTSTTAVTPALRIAAAASPSSAAARAAMRRGCSVFATSWARCRPRRRSSGAGPRRSSPSPAFSSVSKRAGAVRLGPRGDDPDKVAERRIAELSTPLDLLRQEPTDVVPRREADRARVGLEGLDEHPAGRVSAAPPRELGQELEGPFLGAEVREAEAGVRVDDRGERDALEVVSLRDHLRADEDGALRLGEAREGLGGRARPLDRVGVEADQLELRKLRGELALEALRPRAEARELGRRARGARLARGLVVSAVMAAQETVFVQDERDIAVRAADRLAAGAAVERRRDAAAVEQQDRPAAARGDGRELGEQRRRQRITLLVAEIDDTHRRQRPGEASAELEPFQPLPALGTRRRAAVHGDSALERCALGRDRPRVVAGVGLLLVRRVVLLVHADQSESAHRGEDRRAGADHDAGLAGCDPHALVPPLGLSERGVQDRDPVAEAGAEAADRLRCQPDLGDEHDRAHPPLECRVARLEVDLRLAAARRAVQEEVRAEPLVHRPDDPPHRGRLRLAERRRLRLAAERLARRGLRTLGAPRPLERRDQLERASGGRAVVPGDPQRELDQRRRDLVHDPLDRRRVDPLRRSGPDLDDDAAPPRVAEPHLHDRAGADLVRHLVGERPRDRAGGHQRIDGGERHPSSLVRGEARGSARSLRP